MKEGESISCIMSFVFSTSLAEKKTAIGVVDGILDEAGELVSTSTVLQGKRVDFYHCVVFAVFSG